MITPSYNSAVLRCAAFQAAWPPATCLEGSQTGRRYLKWMKTSMVRVAEEADIPHLVAAFPEKPGTPGNRHIKYFGWQRSGELSFLVAWDDCIPIGYVLVRWPGGRCDRTYQAGELGCAEIGDLTVSEDARGKGFGRLLMESAENLVRNRGVKLVGLEVTAHNPSQDVARELYRRLGYQDAGYGEFLSGYTYYDADGQPQRDEELYVYLTKDTADG